MNKPIKNRFTLSEWSGAIGDIGITLPIAFALVVFNGFPPERIFFLWGLVYLVTGWYYKVPVSVQPLKAMAVIAIATGYSSHLLSTTAVFYGILLIVLSATGVIRWLEQWFSLALIRGIQCGLGLILAHKAITLTAETGLFFHHSDTPTPVLNAGIFLAVLLLLWYVQFQKQFPIILVIIPVGIAAAAVLNISFDFKQFSGAPVAVTHLDWTFFLNSLLYLMIPQLPLTLGNAVFSACDACQTFWKERSVRVTPTRLGFSIGVSNVIIGLLGGFPICHGAGGIAAHKQFGGNTGGTTMIVGTVFLVIALINPLSMFLFFIPVPVLGAMLLIVSVRLLLLLKTLEQRTEIIVAIVVGGVSFFTRNLSIAVLIGFCIEFAYKHLQKRHVLMVGAESDD